MSLEYYLFCRKEYESIISYLDEIVNKYDIRKDNDEIIKNIHKYRRNDIIVQHLCNIFPYYYELIDGRLVITDPIIKPAKR